MENTPEITTYNNKGCPYICVHCATPCPSLFRRLSGTTSAAPQTSSSSIKLTTCESCGQIVDPYVEQEWLLVAIDCILLRPEAYRHVLFHPWDATTATTPPLLTPRRAMQFLLAWSILDAYLHWESLREEADPIQDRSLQSSSFVFLLGLQSFLGIMFQWMILSFFCRRSDRRHPPSVSLQIYLALLLPSSFAVVTTLVIVWENTVTVRRIGTLLIVAWQSLALSLVGGWMAPLVSILVRVAWKATVKSLIIPPLPCAGLALDIKIVLNIIRSVTRSSSTPFTDPFTHTNGEVKDWFLCLP